MSVNIVGEDKNLIQVAGNVPTDKVELITLLAAQASEHAKKAEELAEQARELAGKTEESVSNTLPKYRTQSNPQSTGWYRVAKFKGGSAISFSAAIADRYGSIAPTEINFSVALRQMPASVLIYDVDFLQDVYSGATKIDAVRIVAEEDYLALDFNYVSASTDTIYVELFNYSCNKNEGEYSVEMMFEKIDKTPELYYDYTFINGGGRIVNRAINDGEGNNIAASTNEIKSNVASLKAQVAIGPAGWKRILTIPGGLMCFVSVYRNFNYAAPQGVTIMLNTTFYGTSTGRRAIISQLEDLSELNAITKFRITHDGTQEYLEMYYSSSTTNVFDITVSGICCQNLKPPVIDVAAVTEEYDVIYTMSVNPNTAGYPRKLINSENMNMWDCLFIGNRGIASARETIYFPVYTSSCILMSSHVYVDVNDERNPASVNLHMDNSSLVVQMTTARVTQRAPIWLISYIDNSTFDLTRGNHTVIFGGCSLGTNVVSNCVVLGDLNVGSGSITFTNCKCNLRVIKSGQSVIFNNCTGRVIDEFGNNLIS